MRIKMKKVIAWVLFCSLICANLSLLPMQAQAEDNVIRVNAEDYGVDPSGAKDSTEAVWKALNAAKEKEGKGKKVVLEFPKGEYQIYKDKAQVREYHTSNTNSLDYPQKTIGILIEGHENLTIEGNGSLFMMHGNMMALAIVKSENIKLSNFSWDFAVPTVSEMTITNISSENGMDYTDFYIPSCFPYYIDGNTIVWTSEKSPYTGEHYWTERGIHRAYSVVGYSPEEEMTRAYFTDSTGNPFANAQSITQLADGVVRITYAQGRRPEMQKVGMVLELASSAVRETAGAFTWESKNVVVERVNVHFMHGFGWLIQMSTDITYKDCNFMPRENSGHTAVSYADIIHASGAGGKITIEGCNFSNSHDDPINLHGTFTRVEERRDEHTLKLKYIHGQQGGFPQYYKGDKVAFYSRDLLQPLPTGDDREEILYTVEEVVSNPSDNDGRVMEIRFKERLPEGLSDRIGNEPKYVAENVTYAPAVEIKNNTFKNVPTRGILCTTRNKVLIEGNKFLNMSMATIFLSNDSDQWYESGPIRDMTIRNNEFYIKNIGRTSWEYASAVYVHPVTKGGRFPSEDTPIHKNITIEGNTFNMDVDTVVNAESVENLTIRNNKIIRTDPEISIELSSGPEDNQMRIGETLTLNTEKDGDKHERPQDNAFEFKACKNVTLEGNTYDDGLKKYAVLHDMSRSNITNNDEDITVVDNDRNQPVTDPVSTVYYASTAPEVISVDGEGTLAAKKAGSADVYAYYVWNDTIIKSNVLTITVDGQGTVPANITIQKPNSTVLESVSATLDLNTNIDASSTVQWSVRDFATNDSSEIATVDANGIVTAKKNGVVWVRASVGAKFDQIPVIVSLPTAEGVAPGFSMSNEDAAHYSLSKNSYTIDMQSGDLYERTNTVKNLLLYQGSFDRNNVCATVKADNLPINESGQWDTASLLLHKDNDNYISVGKKSHKAGIASVEENAASASETDGNAAQNGLSTAYLGIKKKGNTVTLAFKEEGGTWQDARTINNATYLDSNFNIGFAAWESSDRNKSVTFSDFKVGTADQGFDQVEQTQAINMGEITNAAPTTSNVRFQRNDYTVNEEVSVMHDFADTDNHTEGRTLYLWEYEEDSVKKQVVTTEGTLRAKATGNLTCTVYPVDQYGTPGKTPQKATTSIGQGTLDLSLDWLQLNGVNLLKGDKREFKLLIPGDLQKISLNYHSLMSGEGTTSVLLNDVSKSTKNADALVLDVIDGDVITIRRASGSATPIVYTVNVKTVESNGTQINKVELPEVGLAVETFDQKSYSVTTKKGSSSLKIAGDKSLIDHVELKVGAGRKNIKLTETDGGYEANVSFMNGLNTYYVQVFAKDGITMKQHIVNVIYQPDTTAALTGLNINGKSLDEFQSDIYKYTHTVSEQEDSLRVEAQSGQKVRININNQYKDGNSFSVKSLKKGNNEVYVVVYAADGSKRVTYQVTVIKPFAEDAELLSLKVNDKELLSQFEEADETTFATVRQAVPLSIQARDKGATITIKSGKQKLKGTGSVTGDIALYKNGDQNPTIVVTVTSRDGKNENKYTINILDRVYPSELEWQSATAFNGTSPKRNTAYNGSKMQLVNEQGEPVTFEKGIGTHADSTIVLNAAGQGYERLTGFVGMDYSQYNADHGEVQFLIEVDGVTAFDSTAASSSRVVFDSGQMQQRTPMKAFDVDVRGANTISLKVLSGANTWNDHANWANISFETTFQEEPEVYLTQTIKQTEHGTIKSSAGEQIPWGTPVTYTFEPENGYYVQKAMINGTEVTLGKAAYAVESVSKTYTIESVEENIVVEAVFAKGVDPQDSQNPGTPQNPGTSQNQSTSKPNTSSRPSDDKAVQTGDTAPIGILFFICGISAIFGVGIYKKRR